MLLTAGKSHNNFLNFACFIALARSRTGDFFEETMKQCTKCSEYLSESMFNKSNRNKSGLRAECRDCQKLEGRNYRGPTTRNFGGGRYLKTKVDGVTKLVHRLVMEAQIGMKLTKDEVVHHINGNKKDNRPENLQIMSVSEHSRFENLGKKLSNEHKEKVRQSLIGNQRRKGIPHTPEHKARMSEIIKKIRASKFWSTKKK